MVTASVSAREFVVCVLGMCVCGGCEVGRACVCGGWDGVCVQCSTSR